MQIAILLIFDQSLSKCFIFVHKDLGWRLKLAHLHTTFGFIDGFINNSTEADVDVNVNLVFNQTMKTSKDAIYTISDLSQRFDITTRAIRFYESEGLLSPAREGQKRLYSQKDYTTLKLILRGKRLGWSLAESRELIQMYQPEQNNQAQYQKVLEKVADSRQRLQQQMNDIHVMLLELDEHEARVKEALDTRR